MQNVCKAYGMCMALLALTFGREKVNARYSGAVPAIGVPLPST